ncbi:UPF0464 protein C15orf44-like protein [Camponotus floridanus]|uniref:Integrator complex subunit 14 n=1 Tax=Camponotus floridanus TaxID=104421 RepID=E1ZWM7_CAMFO|nr:UPF0464 protein C15orf44-like protein [Camponotus floridanus]
MPTVIALDVSLSMRRPVLTNGTNDNLQNEPLTRHHLAVHGINALLHYLQVNSKLEFVSLIVFSSLYEVICPFTRDYDSIRAKLQTIEEWDKTCIEGALHGINNVIMAEWGNATACQLYPIFIHFILLDPSLQAGLPLYQRLVDLAGGDSIVLVPESPLSKYSVAACFQKLAEANYVSFQGYLKCGHLGSRILLSPAPMPYTKKADFELVPDLVISKTIEICGFISVGDVGSPSSISRHLVLPLATEKTSSMQDTKKKSNLMLTVLEPGSDVVPWLGNFSNLGPLDAAKTPVSFPVRPTEKRSYTQNAPSWIRQVGLQSDIQKILRHARKLPEKTQNFYKEVNRLRRAAASIGFIELLEGLACILERECTLLPPNLNPDCTIQMGHVASMIRKPEFLELRYNIPPARTKFQTGS